MAGPSSLNVLSVDLRSFSTGLNIFANHLKTHLIRRILDRARTFEFVLHFVKCDTVAVPPTQIYYHVVHGNTICNAIKAL